MSDIYDKFNAESFSQDRYEAIKSAVEQQVGPFTWRMCETPVFLDAELFSRIAVLGRELIAQGTSASVQAKVAHLVPAEFSSPEPQPLPDFVIADFAIEESKDGALAPQLIEIQGVSSLLAFHLLFSRECVRGYGLDKEFRYLPDARDEKEYVDFLKDVILGGQAPENVVILEIRPDVQKTVMDFRAFESILGVRTVGIEDVIRKGDKLYYRRDGHETEIRRIYNRVVPDELERMELLEKIPFRFSEKLDVEWLGHPEWFFRLSKASLPYIGHPAVPETRFLSDIAIWPEDLSGYVLKPTFSFGGRGVRTEVKREDLESIPTGQRGNWLLQEKVDYAHFIPDPEGDLSKAEVRVIYVRKDDVFHPCIMWGRVTKGDVISNMSARVYGKNDRWVGMAPVIAPRKKTGP